MTRLYQIALGLSVLAVLITTLYPFRLIPSALYALPNTLRVFVSGATDAGDLGSNILLFMPLGGAVFGLWIERFWGRQHQSLPSWRSFLPGIKLSLGLAICLSLGVESLQFLIPSRTSSWIDIATNGLGGSLGAGLAALVYGYRSLSSKQRRRGLLSWRGRSLCLLLWLLLCFGVTGVLHQQSRLTNWDANYDLNLGQSGRTNHPWQGEIFQVAWFNQALSSAEMTSAEPQQSLDASRLLFDYQSGEIQTSVSPRLLCDRLQDTSEFTFEVEFSASELDASEPAALFSFSWDAWNSNWVVMRSRRDLWVMLRAPVTAKHHHRRIFLEVPNVFQDSEVHRLSLSYQAAILQGALDGRPLSRQLNLSPDRIFWHYFLPLKLSRYRLEPWGEILTRSAFYGVWMLPVGMLLSSVVQDRWRSGPKWVGGRSLIVLAGSIVLVLLWSRLLLQQEIQAAVEIRAAVIDASAFASLGFVLLGTGIERLLVALWLHDASS